MQLSYLKKKLKILERYICRNGEMKNNLWNNISITFYKINHILYHVTK